MSCLIETDDLEEALDALLARVRWYVVRHKKVPRRLARAFNAFADACEIPNEAPFKRIAGCEQT